MPGSPVFTNDRAQGNIGIAPGFLFLESYADNLASTGANLLTALQLTSEMNRITTTPANSGVVLPPAQPGLTIFVVNHGTNPISVYGSGIDQIDDNPVNTPVTQMYNSTVLYCCTAYGNWYTEGLASGFVRGASLQTTSAQNVTASSSGIQGGGPISANIATITSGGSAYSVTLPTSVVGLTVALSNATSYTANVYPALGDAINGQGANNSIGLGAGLATMFMCTTTGQWYTVPRVPS
jgi:hypothetical protein